MGFPRLLFLVLLSVVGFAQTGQVNVWTPRGPEGGVVGRPVIDPQSPGTLYVNAGYGLLKTADAARHWSVFSAPAPPYARVLAVDPRNSSTLYGVNPNNALFKSTDSGLTWNPSDPLPCKSLTQFQPCLSLSFVIDPGNSSTLYVGHGTDYSLNGGVFQSTDGGVTWNQANTGLPIGPFALPDVHALAIDPKNAGTLYAATGLIVRADGGLFKSTDGAMSWSPVNSGLPDYSIPDAPVIDPQNSNTLYATVSGAPPITGSVFKSTDGGSSWVDTGFKGGNLVFDPQDSGALYAVSSDGIVKSMDGGGNWSVVLPGATSSPGWWVAVTPGEGAGSAVYAGTGWRGIFKSSDGGSTWAAANSGLFATSIYSLAIDPQNPHTVYAEDGAGLYESPDGGVSWSATPILPGVNVFALAIDPQEPGTVYAQAPSGLYKSIDGGASWVQLPVAPSFTDLAGSTFPLAVDTRNPGTVYSGGFKSTDGGVSWARLSLLPTALAIDPQNSGTLYAGTIAGIAGELSVLSISGGVRKSVDGGGSWSGMNTVSQGYGVSSLTVDPTNSSVVYAQTGKVDCSESYDCNSDYGDPNSDETKKGLGLFRSADGGATWAKLDLPGSLFDFYLVGVDPQGTLYAWATAGFLRSMDGGATWNALPIAGLSSAVSVLAFDPQNSNHLFAGTGAGVFEITLAPGHP